MKPAEYLKRTKSIDAMPKTRENSWQLIIGVALAEAGVALVGLGGSGVVNIWATVLIYAGGFLFFGSGIFLVCKEPLSAILVADEPTPGEVSLGKINLNGNVFNAYQEAVGSNGKRFRLRSYPPIRPECEAGFIRYLIHEGWIERNWPRLSGKIKEEAGWAFSRQ
jgi:hypothetical protein